MKWDKKLKRVLRLCLALCVLLSCALLSCGDGATSSGSDTGEFSDSAIVGNYAQPGDSPIAIPLKLEGSTETLDENGIIHGVSPEGISYTLRGRGITGAEPDRVSLAAVGDQIATTMSMPIADAYAGTSEDGLYDFTPFYQEIAPFIQQHDLRFINQETVMAGADSGYSGYPSFNSPDACAEALATVGFNLVGFATNHIYDMGLYGVERSHEVWDRFPEILVGGSYLSQEERDTVHLIERNGMTFAFLAYAYGDNNFGFGSENMPNNYYSCQFDKEQITYEVKRAQALADAVIVAMHWGTEYVLEPNTQQLDYAAFLADLDVDLVLGTHAHIMQPVKYITGSSGNTIPVVFGLSDIVSGWTITDTILSGIFTCEFVRDSTSGLVELENLTWYPTIEWSDGGEVYVRMLKDMDDATIQANTRTEDVSDDVTYLQNLIDSAGMETEVIM